MIARAEQAGGAGGAIGGRVVNVASISAYTGHPDLWYGASKAALVNITKSLGSYLGRHRVLVNAVAPGPTQTAMFDALPKSRRDATVQRAYSGRAGTAAEVAEVVLWLGTVSPEYINGSTVDIENGFHPR